MKLYNETCWILDNAEYAAAIHSVMYCYVGLGAPGASSSQTSAVYPFAVELKKPLKKHKNFFKSNLKLKNINCILKSVSNLN